MGVQCEQKGAGHTDLGGSSVEHRGGVTADPNSLGSACKKFQYPVAECCTPAQSV